ncbi:hypothetical protein R70006_08149 [Paraburkholderia domus]|nr:hypothetical protein R70006_08149 [Paraburkholderia domus]CAE6964712.1 hypothetical protein R70199_07607 [Paraburkholderia domus]
MEHDAAAKPGLRIGSHPGAAITRVSGTGLMHPRTQPAPGPRLWHLRLACGAATTSPRGVTPGGHPEASSGSYQGPCPQMKG